MAKIIIADYGVPLVDRYYVKLNYSSTLDGSVLILTCESVISIVNTTEEQIFSVTCHRNGSWSPDPAEFIESCSSFTTAPLGNLIKKEFCSSFTTVDYQVLLYSRRYSNHQ